MSETTTTEATQPAVALLLSCATEYEDSATALEGTPRMERFVVDRHRKARELRALAARLTALPASPDAGTREREEAERWRALMACKRIRILGGAGEGTPDALIGVEFYATWAGEQSAHSQSRREFVDFVDALRAARAAVAPTTSEETREDITGEPLPPIYPNED